MKVQYLGFKNLFETFSLRDLSWNVMIREHATEVLGVCVTSTQEDATRHPEKWTTL